MRHLTLLMPVVFASFFATAQPLTAGVFGGLSNYQGDLVDKYFVSRFTKAAVGLSAGYELKEHWSLRGGLMFTKLTGNDKYNTKTYLQARNLNFTTSITELSLVGEYATFNLDDKRWTPYLFGGVALYHFNPYTFDEAGGKVFLKPLSTEGEGLTGYAQKPYSLTQLALPFGGGFRFAVTDNIRIGIELGIRKLFTDHLDDVSGNYASITDLLRERGPLAVDYAYRGDELPGAPTDPIGLLFPQKGAQRGGATQKDWYYLTGLTLSFRLHSKMAYGSLPGKRKGYGCPASPL